MSSSMIPKTSLPSKINRSYSDEKLDEHKRKEQQAKPRVAVRIGPHPLLRMTPHGSIIKPIEAFWSNPRHVVTTKKGTDYKKVAFLRAVEHIPEAQDNDNDEAEEQYSNMM